MKSLTSSLAQLSLVLLVIGAVAPPATAKDKKKATPKAAEGAKTITAPAKGTHHEAIIEGFKLVKAGEYDKWVETWCHKEKLCSSDHAIRSLEAFNLKVLHEKLNKGECLGGKDDTIQVTRTEGKPEDGKVKVFIHCAEKSSPRPYSLEKAGGGWKFTRI